MKKIILIITIFLLSITSTYACSCVGNSNPYNSLKSADAVFIGQVINTKEITEKRDKSDGDYMYQLMGDIKYNLVEFNIDTIIKGEQSDKLFLKTDAKNSSCHKSFPAGKKYIVYAYSYQNQLGTSFCSRTRELKYAQEDIQAFKGLIENNITYNLLIISIYKYYIIGVILFALMLLYIRYKMKNNKKSK